MSITKANRVLSDATISKLKKLDNGEKRNTVIVNKLLDSQCATDDDRALVYAERRKRYQAQ